MSLHEQPDRPLAGLEPIAAVLVLAYLWIDIWVGVMWLPTWLPLGPVTLPWSVLPPMALGTVVLWGFALTVRSPQGYSRLDLGLGVLGGLTILGGVYAIVNLNVAEPGVFFAGMIPVGFGFLLAVALLIVTGLRYLAKRT